jgi:hypothetical protein
MPSFFIEPPPGAVMVSINVASAREITTYIPASQVDKLFESFTSGSAFTITSVVDPVTGTFDRIAINPNLVEYMRVRLVEPKESDNVRNIQRVRPFDPDGGGS